MLREGSRFLAVGGLAYLVDVGLSNYLVFAFDGQGPLVAHPLTAKVISTSASMVVAWLGNRAWTFGTRKKGSKRREIALFLLVNIVSMFLALAPLGVTWHILGLRDALSYNLSTNVLGMALAMTFRFLAYRTWVFRAVE